MCRKSTRRRRLLNLLWEIYFVCRDMGEHDDAPYISEDLRKSKLGEDCLSKAHNRILDEGWANQGDIDDIFKESDDEVKSAIHTAESEKVPDPYSHNWSAYSSSILNK